MEITMRVNPFKALIAGIALSASFAATASIIEYNGYSRDTANDYVSNGTLDWMAWDQTLGLTVEAALTANSGWRLASESEMSSLYSSFAFGGQMDWQLGSSVSTEWQAGYDQGYEHFVDMFGSTFFNTASTSYGDPSKSSAAIFGSINDGNYGVANVGTDSKFWYARRGYEVVWGAGANVNNCAACDLSTYSNGSQGIALVRDSGVAQVSEPSTIAVFGLALAGFALRLRARA